MRTEKVSFSVDSALPEHKVKGFIYSPVVKANVKAIFPIAHGMAEHKERYDEFCSFMAENGYAVMAYDHIGHGESVNSDEELGFFGARAGWRNLIEDVNSVIEFAKGEFGNKPVILFGHSMGSFIARAYTKKYGIKLAAAVFCGTSGANPAAGIAVRIADAVAKSKGDTYRSEFINTLAFGAYNKKIKPARTDFDWLSTVEEEVDKYVADKYCGFLFTACGFRDLFTLLKSVSDKSWYKGIRKELPMLLISGDADPVGEYGKGVRQVYKELKNTGHEKTSLKLYPGDRHEILNEADRQTVMEDILAWCDKQLSK